MSEYKKKLGAENLNWGRDAETIAQELLIKEGYAIRETNWRKGNTIEIDIIAQKDTTMVFVEVKARKGDVAQAEAAVDLKKRKMMVRGADCYLRSLPFMFEYRFDIVAISGNNENYTVNHIIDAFLPPLK